MAGLLWDMVQVLQCIGHMEDFECGPEASYGSLDVITRLLATRLTLPLQADLSILTKPCRPECNQP